MCIFFFFFKQKTAYEMRMSDWSSDVCSSDLARLVTLHQVHSAKALTVTSPWPDDARPQADAVVTDTPGLLLGILTADCAPVLFADPDAGVIRRAHAGWDGAVRGATAPSAAAGEMLGDTRSRRSAGSGGASASPQTTPHGCGQR